MWISFQEKNAAQNWPTKHVLPQDMQVISDCITTFFASWLCVYVYTLCVRLHTTNSKLYLQISARKLSKTFYTMYLESDTEKKCY